MEKTEEYSRTVPAILKVYKLENGNICIYNINTDHPELSFAVEMDPETARRVAKSMTGTVDEKVLAGDPGHIRAEQIRRKSKGGKDGAIKSPKTWRE